MVPNTQPGSRQNGETKKTLIPISELIAGLRSRSQAGHFGSPQSAHHRLSLDLEIADRHLNLYTPIIDCAAFFGYSTRFSTERLNVGGDEAIFFFDNAGHLSFQANDLGEAVSWIRSLREARQLRLSAAITTKEAPYVPRRL